MWAQSLFGAQGQRRVDAGMTVAAGRIRLHAGLHQLVGRAEILNRPLRYRRRRIGSQKAVRAFDGLAGAFEPFARQCRGNEPGHRRPAHLKSLSPGAGLEKLQAACGLAQCDAQRRRHARRVEPEHTGSGRGGPKSTASRGRVKALFVVLTGRERQRDTANDFVTGNNCRQRRCAGGVGHLRGRQRRRNDRRARMQSTRSVRIVEIQGVREHTLEECGPRRRVGVRGAEDAAPAARQIQRRDCRQQRRRTLGLMTANDIADQVENEQACATENLHRNFIDGELRAKFRELCRNTHSTKPSVRLTEPRGRQSAAFQCLRDRRVRRSSPRNRIERSAPRVPRRTFRASRRPRAAAPSPGSPPP